jgi:hypothetical protein
MPFDPRRLGYDTTRYDEMMVEWRDSTPEHSHDLNTLSSVWKPLTFGENDKIHTAEKSHRFQPQKKIGNRQNFIGRCQDKKFA